uniref:hypothetical protein n=1 Tax=Intestinimonas butyriciproducens TaxID=1297617 RepID=UPI0034A48D2C
ELDMMKDKNNLDFPFYHISYSELKEKIRISTSLGVRIPSYFIETLKENRLNNIKGAKYE